MDPKVTASQQPFTGFSSWLSPSYDPEHNPQKKFVDAIDLSVLPRGLAHNTLLFYLSELVRDPDLSPCHLTNLLGSHLLS